MNTKKRTLFFKMVLFVNSIFAFLLLVAYLIPFIKPEVLGSFSAFSLITPFLILINIFFVLYWIYKLSAAFFLSFLLLAAGFYNLPRLYKISGKKVLLTDDIKLMSYNVRMFNRYKWIKKDSVRQKINDLIAYKSPGILCLQEYAPNPELEKKYPFHYIKFSRNNPEFGHAIFSKFPIVNKGSINFEKTANIILFADLKIDTDTVRVYNIHLQSLRINPDKENFGEKNPEKLRERISSTFRIQQHQILRFLAHEKQSPYKDIIAGDFNNTAFSWAYGKLLHNKKDAFVEAGKGFGSTYKFTFPIRIDFIMPDKSIEVNSFKTYGDKLSDHYPVMARLDRASLFGDKS